MEWIFLSDGQSAERIRATLGDLRSRLETVRGGAANGSAATFADSYLRWVESADYVLRGVFDDDGFRGGLYSARYWRIRDVDDSTSRAFPLVGDEIKDQLEHIAALDEQLQSFVAELDAPAGTQVVVPDTNLYIHYRRFTELPWTEIVGAKRVRLLVPLVVVDELDDLKNRGGKRGERAATVVKAMRGLSAQGGGVFDVRNSVDLKHFPEPAGHLRRANLDDEILRQCLYASSAGSNLIVMTGDYGMQLRAEILGLPQRLMPDEYRLLLELSEG